MKTSLRFISLFLLPLFSLVLSAPVATPTAIEARDLNGFLAQIALLFPFSGLLQDVEGLLRAGEQAIANIFGTKTTQNGLSGSCGAITVLFARGTTEPGNVGVLAGPPFFDALQSRVGAGNVVVQGITYAADVEGFLVGGDPTGSQNMANAVQQARSKCPSTKIVMAGYSQGSQIVHNAAKILGSSVMGAISSVVMFGDPNNGFGVANIGQDKVLTVCHADDLICAHLDVIILGHLTYAANAVQAANFAASKAGF